MREMKSSGFYCILASSSPRRRALLKQAGINFKVLALVFPREDHKGRNVKLAVEHAALNKARIAYKLASEEEKFKYLRGKPVISADTVVILNNKILGKPKNKKEAFRMLKALSGKTHKVITGIALGYNGKFLADSETTLVTFKKLTNKEIVDYISSGEPMDKAGAYGIQGKAALFVKRIRGCYFNVVGLPIYKLMRMFEKIKDGK